MESSSTTSTMVASDPVSSLRAAALSTRKSKRRKAAVEMPVTLSLRPPPSNEAFQLDYGQEETTDNTPQPNNIPSAPGNIEKREKTPNPSEDVQMREEGEISDEEGPPPIPITSNDHIRRPAETPEADILEVKNTEEAIPTNPEALFLRKSLSPEPPQILPLVDRISVMDEPLDMPEQDEDADSPMLDLFEQSSDDYDLDCLDPDHVRPGLELTQDEYDTAKDIILDLLGWGIPFDHLVECGISNQLIFYVFNELDLCLPDTFDSSGIICYAPEASPESHQSDDDLPPPLPERHDNSIDSDEFLQMGPPSNPVTPLLPMNDAPPSFDLSSGADLHDMERRRRQELMARKAAVQASRKQKQSVPLEPLPESSLPNDPMIVEQDKVEAPPYAATETVEDFLNSLGTVQGLDTSPRGTTRAPSQGHPETKTIETFSGHIVDIKDYDQEGPLNSSASESFSVSSIQNQPFSLPPPPSGEPPPSSVASTTSNFSQISSPVPDNTHRRGVKRPVASDFVDLDPPPKRHDSGRTERLNGTGGITRRLNSRTSFQTINSRRCVIDLSDSEDDDEEQPRYIDEPPQLWRDKRTYPASFPPPAPIKPVSSGTITPAALEQKELEIRQMRELIARAEETRLRKLALAKSASVNSGQPIALTPVIETKQIKVEEVEPMIISTEETDEMDVQAPESSGQSESGTPPPAGADHREHSLTPEAPGFPSNIQEPQAGSHTLDEEGQGLPDESVDADQITSPSAQMSTNSIPSALPEQGAKMHESSPPLPQVQDSHQDTFSSYRSPFDLYPLLRSNGSPVSSSSHLLFSRSSSDMYSSRPSLSFDSNSVDTEKPGLYSTTFSSSSLLPDLKPLRLATLAKSLDPFKRLCQFEVPGGGTCRDEGCEDIHLSRLEDANHVVALEPNDEDTANYLFDKLPPLWLHNHHVASPSRILSALQDIHRRNPNNQLPFEDRVSLALDSLGSAPTT